MSATYIQDSTIHSWLLTTVEIDFTKATARVYVTPYVKLSINFCIIKVCLKWHYICKYNTLYNV